MTKGAKEIALFLRNNEEIDKEKLGEFLGGHEELNMLVLSEFTELLDFKDFKLDQAIRKFLEAFQLVGEA